LYMADFLKAYTLTAKNEGGYAKDPDDTGGETYKGISRNNWKTWPGWKYIDQIKQRGKGATFINQEAAKISNLQVLVQEFYKQNFWYSNNLQLIADQQLANNVYDFGVNAGTGAAAIRLQRAANAVCGSLVVDGQIGNKTIAQVNKLNAKDVYDAFNGQRKSFYDNIIAKNPSQAKFKNSWYSRIVPYQA
jgi:lysozyme family protein